MQPQTRDCFAADLRALRGLCLQPGHHYVESGCELRDRSVFLNGQNSAPSTGPTRPEVAQISAYCSLSLHDQMPGAQGTWRQQQLQGTPPPGGDPGLRRLRRSNLNISSRNSNESRKKHLERMRRRSRDLQRKRGGSEGRRGDRTESERRRENCQRNGGRRAVKTARGGRVEGARCCQTPGHERRSLGKTLL